MASRIISKRLRNAAAAAPRLRQARSVVSSAAAAVPPRETGETRRSRPMTVAPFGLFDIWEPAATNRSMRQMMDIMNKYMDVPSSSSFSDRTLMSGVRTPWDVVEKQDAFYLRVDMPGLDKHEVKINVEDEELVIRGEHKPEQGKGEVFSSPRSYNTRMILPKEVQRDNISAELKNGVLTVVVPKLKPEEKKVREVSIS